MWINDFDNNGTIEQIMTQYYNEGNYPLHMKKELTNQIVKLKKIILRQMIMLQELLINYLIKIFLKIQLSKSLTIQKLLSLRI